MDTPFLASWVAITSEVLCLHGCYVGDIIILQEVVLLVIAALFMACQVPLSRSTIYTTPRNPPVL